MDLYIRIACFAIPILFGAFSAKRLNFIHGLIVGFSWYFIIAGVYLCIGRFSDSQVAHDMLDFFNKYLTYIITIPVAVVSDLVISLGDKIPDEVIENIDIIYMVVPIVIMCITGFISRLFRGKRV